MGYSSTKDASDMLGLIRKVFGDGNTSNGLLIRGRSYFYEVGREHADGHITGTLYENIDATHAEAAGSFSISAKGTVTRFPHITREGRLSLYFRFLELRRTNPMLLSSYSHGAI